MNNFLLRAWGHHLAQGPQHLQVKGKSLVGKPPLSDPRGFLVPRRGHKSLLLLPPEAVGGGEGRSQEGDDPGRGAPWLVPTRLCWALQARQVGEEMEVEKDDGRQGPPDGWQWRLAFLWVSGW